MKTTIVKKREATPMKMDDNNDLLDLCRLSLMEGNVADSPALDRNTTLEAIKWKKKQLAAKIINKLPQVMDIENEPEPEFCVDCRQLFYGLSESEKLYLCNRCPMKKMYKEKKDENNRINSRKC